MRTVAGRVSRVGAGSSTRSIAAMRVAMEGWLSQRDCSAGGASSRMSASSAGPRARPAARTRRRSRARWARTRTPTHRPGSWQVERPARRRRRAAPAARSARSRARRPARTARPPRAPADGSPRRRPRRRAARTGRGTSRRRSRTAASRVATIACLPRYVIGPRRVWLFGVVAELVREHRPQLADVQRLQQRDAQVQVAGAAAQAQQPGVLGDGGVDVGHEPDVVGHAGVRPPRRARGRSPTARGRPRATASGCRPRLRACAGDLPQRDDDRDGEAR